MPRAALVRSARRVADRAEAIEAIAHLDPRAEVLITADANTPLPRYEGGFEPVDLDHTGDRIVLAVDAGDGGYLVLSEVWDRGWGATVDGEPADVLVANGIFRAIQLAPGAHRVEFVYAPRGYRVGRWISGLSLPIVFVALVWPRRRSVSG
jgi:uncharacterized membrane protein YfhO